MASMMKHRSAFRLGTLFEPVALRMALMPLAGIDRWNRKPFRLAVRVERFHVPNVNRLFIVAVPDHVDACGV